MDSDEIAFNLLYDQVNYGTTRCGILNISNCETLALVQAVFYTLRACSYRSLPNWERT
jgi:hypothetical protein